jgi:hypothetical protein
MRSSVSAADLDALRAAIGGGVVLPCALALTPAQALTAGTLMWPSEHAHRVLHEWRAWLRAASEEVTSVARLVRAPHLAGVAPALRGRAFVAVDVAIMGEPADAAVRLAALRRLEPEHDTVGIASSEELLARHAPVEGVQAIGEHVLLRELPAQAIDAFIAAAGPDSRSELVSAELRHVGGAEFAAVGIGVAGDADQAQRVRIALEQLARRLAPWAPPASAEDAGERDGR